MALKHNRIHMHHLFVQKLKMTLYLFKNVSLNAGTVLKVNIGFMNDVICSNRYIPNRTVLHVSEVNALVLKQTTRLEGARQIKYNITLMNTM